jgi:endonuclease/exonuclease/phosphatase family metal-dependent hydrolase
MLAAFESFFHRLRRRLSRSEWAIRHLGLTPSEGTSESPGLLLIQIDGFSRTQLERAMVRGRMPFLRRLVQANGYDVHTFYPGLPSTTPAVQAELFYGVHAAVPAFSFYNRDSRTLGRMFYPDWAKAFEADYATKAEGLLKGGSCWSNIYTGGAGQNESHFCAASIGLGDMWRTGKIRNIFVFILLQFPAALRILRLLIVESAVALWDALKGVWRGENAWHELIVAASRIFISVGLRELVTIGGEVDVVRGLPVVHVNFLGYDEQAHGRGPGSRFAHWCLRDIDRAIRRLYRAAHRSTRRDYTVWVFSDHGQEAVRSFALEKPGGIEAVVRDCYELSQRRDPAWRARPQHRHSPLWISRGARTRRKLDRLIAADALTAEEEVTFTIAAIGPVGHIYFAKPVSDEQRTALAQRLVKQGEVPGVLMRATDGAITWHHARGVSRVPEDVPSLLPHPESMRAEIARDLVGLCQHRHAGDLILFGWSPWGEPWTFAPERGAHGGPGPEETRGFALLPARTRLPEGTSQFIRPENLRAAALHLLGRSPMPLAPRVTRTEPIVRVMTYNAHGCHGMDGRVSPRRIARVISTYAPDIVALQELDLGRRRSRAEDQAAMIARELGLHLVFCPAITRGEEHYGHALLSPWPIEIVKRARLPTDPGGWWTEPRVGLWACVRINGVTLNVVTTHLGLGRNERVAQMQALLGDEWLGEVTEREPCLLCGDLNAMPGSRPYALATKRLRDVQAADPNHRPLRTFSSARPLMRLDHIFVSEHFATTSVFVPRTDLTRVASDHLPLIADLRVATAGAGTSTTRRPSVPAHTGRARSGARA